jgi:hypothetical protein
MRNQKRKIRNFKIRDFEVTDGKELLGVRYRVQNEGAYDIECSGRIATLNSYSNS